MALQPLELHPPDSAPLQGVPRSLRRLAASLAFSAVAFLGVAGWRWSTGLPERGHRGPLPARGIRTEELFSVPSEQDEAGAGDGSQQAPQWEVLWETGVNVRSNASFSGEILRVQPLHSIVRGRQEGSWLRLSGGGFMAVYMMGAGTLLKEVETEKANSRHSSDDRLAGPNGGSTATQTMTLTSTSIRPPSNPGCRRNYTGGPAECFCKLSGNPGCEDIPCQCPGGNCSAATATSRRTVTFKNLRSATGCNSSMALLTIPKWYYMNIQDLRTMCPGGTASLLSEMIRAGYERYQRVVAAGPVKQCIHAAGYTSQAWIHLHTVCAGGTIDGMKRTVPGVYWCGVSHRPSDAGVRAQEIIDWASR